MRIITVISSGEQLIIDFLLHFLDMNYNLAGPFMFVVGLHSTDSTGKLVWKFLHQHSCML